MTVRELLRLRDYRLLLAAAFVSLTGDWILATGLAYQVYVLTGSTLAGAGMVLAALLPQVLVGSFAGVCADRWDRRRTMIAANLVLAVVLLPLFTGQVVVVLAVLVVQNAVSAFFTSAEAALVPSLVPGPLLTTANALNGQVRDVARLAGAALGGLLAGRGGIPLLALADIATFLLAAALLTAIRHRHRPVPAARAGAAREWRDGLRLAAGSRVLRTILAFVAITGVGEAIMATLMAPFVRDVLHGDARGYGAVMAAQAVGGLAGGLVATLVGRRFTARALLGWGAVAFGVLDLVLFLHPLLLTARWPALVLMLLIGLPGALTLAGLVTLFQLATTDAHRGRIFGAATAVQAAAMLIGTLTAGSLATHAGIITILTVQGAGYCAAGVLVLLAVRPDYGRVRDRPAEPVAAG